MLFRSRSVLLPGDELISQVDEAEERLQTVKAVLLPRQHSKKQIEFGERSDADGGGHTPSLRRRSRKAIGVRASEMSPSTVIGTKVTT